MINRYGEIRTPQYKHAALLKSVDESESLSLHWSIPRLGICSETTPGEHEFPVIWPT